MNRNFVAKGPYIDAHARLRDLRRPPARCTRFLRRTGYAARSCVVTPIRDRMLFRLAFRSLKICRLRVRADSAILTIQRRDFRQVIRIE
jgi:hypothetical protein